MGPDATFYPGMGCIRIGNGFHNMQALSDQLGRHLWEAIVIPRGHDHERRMYLLHGHDAFYQCLSVSLGDSASLFTTVHPTLRGLLPMVFVQRIQRAVRAWLRRRWESRALTVAMGVHPRLGSDGHLRLLDLDMLRCVLSHC